MNVEYLYVTTATQVRIKYDPNFDANAVPHPSFQANGYASFFLSNADFSNGGEVCTCSLLLILHLHIHTVHIN